MINFEFTSLRYSFEVLTEFNLPYFLGSAFRGIFGRRLKKIVCIKPFEDCKVCEFKKSCPYTNVFETEAILNTPSKYVMRPPYKKIQVKPGDTIYIDITLLKDIIDFHQFITASFLDVLNLGKNRIVKLKEVEYFHPFENKFYKIKSFLPKFEAKDFFKLENNKKTLKLRLYPTTLKFDGKIIGVNDFNEDVFKKAIAQRLLNIAINYGSLENGKLSKEEFDFKISKSNLNPSPLKRYSNRKNTLMKIPAFEGNIEIEGNINSVYPYLKMLEVLSLGKSVSLGLGKFEILT